MIYVYTNIKNENIEFYKILFTNVYIHMFPKSIQRAAPVMLFRLCFIVKDVRAPNTSIILKILINLPFDRISITCRQHNGEMALFYLFLLQSILSLFIQIRYKLIRTYMWSFGSSKTYS